MGCGCRGGGKRNNRRTSAPVSRPATNVRLRAAETNKSDNSIISGMTKQQRDAERKRRIQQIIARRSGQ